MRRLMFLSRALARPASRRRASQAVAATAATVTTRPLRPNHPTSTYT